jgi:hypothetical protein
MNQFTAAAKRRERILEAVAQAGEISSSDHAHRRKVAPKSLGYMRSTMAGTVLSRRYVPGPAGPSASRPKACASPSR